jgi:kumamolisin
MPRKTIGHRLVGPVPPSEEMEVLLLLRGASDNNSSPHDTFALGKLPVHERAHLELDELLNLNPARKADIEAVRRFASTHHLEVASVDRRRRSMVLTGRVRDVNRAFDVDILEYKSGNLAFRSHKGPHAHPRELAGIVSGIFGLDNRPLAKRPRHTHFPPEESLVPPRQNENTKPPSEFTRLYGFPKGATGKGQTIGVLEFDGGFDPPKLRSYLHELQVSTPRVIVREVPPGENRPVHQPGALSSDVEVYMDLEILASVAPGATLVVYFARNNARGWVEALQTAISDKRHRPSVLSISWGRAEQYWSPQAIDAIEEQLRLAARQGITVCCSSGDRGVFEAEDQPYTVPYPASSPYVLACGGTSLEVLAGGNTSEIVWNESRVSGVASGGGISALFDQPPFQAGHRVPARFGKTKAGRGIPDVAANASSATGYLIWADDTTPMSLGGTSAATPLWAGLIACLNEALGQRVGYLTPLLYGRRAHRTGALLDIRTGNNQLLGRQGYRARRGWDPCTGLGSPQGTKLLGWLQSGKK